MFFEHRVVLKRHSLAFILSLLSCFFCLDSLLWHGLASLNLVISTQHCYSAQINFDMHKFKLFVIFFVFVWIPFQSCIAISCVWYQKKEKKMPLIIYYILSLIQSCMGHTVYFKTCNFIKSHPNDGKWLII